MQFKRKEKTSSGIPTSSMPDIVFMLLIFFMVSTVLREYQGLSVILPEAEKIEKLETKRHVAYVWIAKDGTVSIQDKLMEMSNVRNIMYQMRKNDPQIIVSLRADKGSQMGLITEFHQELREADALKINYSSKTEA
ncbi:MAG: biopolymer transporter ExbD [Candidatus Marinimicrobia bacterium]|nr:biopolymer transporter ExbD [Candidatus Neomarinimicrobiota bacterium]MCF7827996.1 biopolymer transporter ExbD [Candidatus Neomarinimicrobiota bacterium]MCF7879249.1 biopolymer transporter ExbD [Candidatus Neomarinimicrobiota bacterium]